MSLNGDYSPFSSTSLISFILSPTYTLLDQSTTTTLFWCCLSSNSLFAVSFVSSSCFTASRSLLVSPDLLLILFKSVLTTVFDLLLLCPALATKLVFPHQQPPWAFRYKHCQLITFEILSSCTYILEFDPVLLNIADVSDYPRGSTRPTLSRIQLLSSLFICRAHRLGVCSLAAFPNQTYNLCLAKALLIFQDGCTTTIGAGRLCPATSSSRNARLVIYGWSERS